eukprot:m51a1_g5590 putative camp phosphodiesterase (857) ;mRNA; f:646363-649551
MSSYSLPLPVGTVRRPATVILPSLDKETPPPTPQQWSRKIPVSISRAGAQTPEPVIHRSNTSLDVSISARTRSNSMGEVHGVQRPLPLHTSERENVSPTRVSGGEDSDGDREREPLGPPRGRIAPMSADVRKPASPEAPKSTRQRSPLSSEPVPLDQPQSMMTPKKAAVSASDLLAQSLTILQEIKHLVRPQQADYIPDELHCAVVGECQGIGEILLKLGIKTVPINGDYEAVSKIRSAKPTITCVICDSALPKIPAAAFVTSIMSAFPVPVITLRTTIMQVLRESHIQKGLQQNVTAHAKLLSHLSKILIEQDVYTRSLSEHVLILEKYKKQSETLIQSLKIEVDSLQTSASVQHRATEKLKLENAAMRWKRACDAVTRVPKRKAPSDEEMALEAVATAAQNQVGGGDPDSAAQSVLRASSREGSFYPGLRDSPFSRAGSAINLNPVNIENTPVYSPLQMITHVVRKLSRIDHYLDKEDMKNVLVSVLKAMAAKEWFIPQYDQLDGQTQMWVDQTFRNEVSESQPVSASTSQQDLKAAACGEISLQVPQSIEYSIPPEELKSWAFNAPSYSHEQLMKAVVFMFQELRLMADFSIPATTLLNFVHTLESNYKVNPYHNFAHIVDVAQVCFMLLQIPKLQEMLQRMDTLALMVGAVCHDVDHPGLNNVFQINAKTALALLYNDHKEEVNLTKNFTGPQLTEFRREVVSVILATDMTKHFELVSRFESRTEMGSFSSQRKEDRQLLLDICLHAADISNLIRPLDVSRVWSDMLFEEYLRQGDEEKRLGLPVSPYMDRNDTDQVKMSLNFVDFIGLPLFNSLARVFREMQICVDRLKSNRKFWEDRKPKPPAPAGNGTK